MGGVVDAQEGTLTIKSLDLVIKLEKQSKRLEEQGIFVAFGAVQPVPVVGFTESWGEGLTPAGYLEAPQLPLVGGIDP